MSTAVMSQTISPHRVRSPGLVPYRTPVSPHRATALPNSLVGAGLVGGTTPVAVQHGLFDELLTTAVPGLLGAASSFLGGDSEAAVGQLRQTGAGAASSLVQQGAGALGGMVGGGAGEQITSLGGQLGQGLGSVITGESTAGEAAGGALTAAQPLLMTLLSSLLGR